MTPCSPTIIPPVVPSGIPAGFFVSAVLDTSAYTPSESLRGVRVISIAFQGAGRSGSPSETSTVAASNAVPIHFVLCDFPTGNGAFIDSSHFPAALCRLAERVTKTRFETTTAVSNRPFSYGEHRAKRPSEEEVLGL